MNVPVPVPLVRRRRLRNRSTEAEAALWRILRDRRFAGFKFRRQHPLGPFIVDFFCARGSLAIELDGGQHFEPSARAYDAWRTRFLEERGIRVIRFADDLVFRETEAVLEAIFAALKPDPSP